MEEFFDKKIVRTIITSLRIHHNMTQTQLEKALNLSRDLISHYETGRNDLNGISGSVFVTEDELIEEQLAAGLLGAVSS